MAPTSMNKDAHSGFETKTRPHQKSKTEISVTPQKGLMSSKIFFEKKRANILSTFPRILNAGVLYEKEGNNKEPSL